MGLFAKIIAVFVIILAYQAYKISIRPVPEKLPEKFEALAIDSFLRLTVINTADILGLNFSRWILKKASTLNYKPSDSVVITDEFIGDIRVLVYKPNLTHIKPVPVLAYYHGGGWVWGVVEAFNEMLSKLAQELGIVIINVDYRLAPEHPFPAAYEDAATVVQFLSSSEGAKRFNIDPKQIAVAGDSAGGNLATAVAYNMRNKVRLQIPIYPVTQAANLATPSYSNYAEGLILYRTDMAYFIANYLGIERKYEADMVQNRHTTPIFRKSSEYSHVEIDKVKDTIPKNWNYSILLKSNTRNEETTANNKEFMAKYGAVLRDTRFSPLLGASSESLKHVPRSLFILANEDVLRDDGILYAYRLHQAGANVQVKLYEEAFHGVCGVFSFDVFRRQMYADISKYLKDNFKLQS